MSQLDDTTFEKFSLSMVLDLTSVSAVVGSANKPQLDLTFSYMISDSRCVHPQ